MSSIAENPEARSPRPHHHVEAGRRVATVALVGPDGAGKTAIAKALLEASPLPLKYLYMGTSIESSNVALPTSRWIHQWKVYRHKMALQRSGQTVPKEVTLHGLEHRVDRRGKWGACGRLLRRVSEESYRQLVSWLFQIRGHVVLYDRHFLFDACPPPADAGDHRLTERMHHWFLRRLYPRPGLVIMLDAPPEVLFARKQEVPTEHLQMERERLAQKRSYAKSFVAVDATQPFEQVLNVVNQLVTEHCR